MATKSRCAYKVISLLIESWQKYPGQPLKCTTAGVKTIHLKTLARLQVSIKFAPGHNLHVPMYNYYAIICINATLSNLHMCVSARARVHTGVYIKGIKYVDRRPATWPIF